MSKISDTLDAALDIMSDIITEFKKMDRETKLNSRNINALSTCIKTLFSLKAYEDKEDDVSDLTPEEIEREVEKTLENIRQSQAQNGKNLMAAKALKEITRIKNETK
jgi:hypothetical protein